MELKNASHSTKKVIETKETTTEGLFARNLWQVLRFLTIRKFVSTVDARVGNYWVGEVCVTIFSPILNSSAL